MFGGSLRFPRVEQSNRIPPSRKEFLSDRTRDAHAKANSNENVAQPERARCLPGPVPAEYDALPDFARWPARYLRSATLTLQIGNRSPRASAARQPIRRNS